ncbi:MAG: hypothetical protein IJS45_07520 [Clostridia bacterium]|nr:hypothetical protein [Clostridia bacterium]
MRPVFKIGTHDYTTFLAADGLSPVNNDLDADGSGRNLLDGLMYRARIAQKEKWAVKFNRLPELIMKSIAEDINGEYTDVTLLNPKLNRVITKTYYISTLTYGTQRYDKSKNETYYDGCTFNMTER